MDKVRFRTTPAKQVERAQREGWGYDGSQSTEQEVLQLLYALVKVEKPEVLVETGTFAAAGTNALVTGIRDNGKGHLWTVEYEDTKFTPDKDITFVRADSKEWATDGAPDFIDFCFLDCGEPEHRIQVMANIWPKINKGGLVLCHDIFFYEDEFLERLEEAAWQKADITFPALNGVAMWRKK